MLKLWAFNIRYTMDDWSKINMLTSVMATNEKQAGELSDQMGLERIRLEYPKLKVLKKTVDSIPIEIKDLLFAGEIVDYTFDQKLNWAERDVVKGITEGKPLRESLSMVLCAVSEDAYNRGRLAAQHAH